MFNTQGIEGRNPWARMPKPSGWSPMVSRENAYWSDREAASPLSKTRNLLNNWAQVRSKHLLDSVAPEVAARIDYTYSTSRLKRVATSALHTALLVLKVDSQTLRELSDSLRIAAEVMEYLADLPDETRHVTTRIIAAGLYQLAGYEANSMCIARALPLTPLPRPGGIPRLADILDRWTLLALRRQLLRLRVETETFTQNREHLEQRWIEGADEGDSGERLVDLAAALVAADMYGSLAFAALRGPAAEDSFRRASEELSELLSTSGRALELLETRTLQGSRRACHSEWSLESDSKTRASGACMGAVRYALRTRDSGKHARCHKPDRALGVSEASPVGWTAGCSVWILDTHAHKRREDSGLPSLL